MRNHKDILNRSIAASLSLFLAAVFYSDPALAVNVSYTITDISKNMVESTGRMPGLVAGASYALGLLFGILGVLKLKEHVENPGNGAGQTPLRTPMIRLIIGGALFALPIIYESMRNAINAGDFNYIFDAGYFSVGGLLSAALGGLGSVVGQFLPNVSGVLAAIVESIRGVPALISAVSYLLALVLGVAGLIKIKDHVESPEQTPMREGVVRLLVGGALFALPHVFNAMASLIDGGDGFSLMGQIGSIFGSVGWAFSPYAGGGFLGFGGGVCNPFGTGLGSIFCSTILNSGAAPAFLSALSYLFGLILGVWGILKIRDHVLNPQQTQVWEGFSRFLAGGAFFALPVSVEAIRSTVTPVTLTAFATDPITKYHENGIAGCEGLDGALFCMMTDITGPVHNLLNFFTFVAGMIFIMIGISRLIKSAQEGARGPGGIGTFMTFLAGGALISYNEFMRAFTFSFFNNPTTRTYAELQYTDGMEDTEKMHAHTVITAVLKFMIIVGLISFVRGIFIIRNVAEGNSQASIMAGITHMVGGSLAVNLGPLLRAVQSTLNLTDYGILFT